MTEVAEAGVSPVENQSLRHWLLQPFVELWIRQVDAIESELTLAQ